MYFFNQVESLFRKVLASGDFITLSSYTEDEKEGTVRFWVSWKGTMDWLSLDIFIGQVTSLVKARYCDCRIVQSPFLHFDYVFHDVKFLPTTD